MTDLSNLGEIERRIAVLRENLRALTEQAAARSGAADEDLAADRIAEQESSLAALVKLRDTLGPRS
jgi:hypothetical protein